MDFITLFGLASGVIVGAVFTILFIRLAGHLKRWPLRVLVVLLACWWAVIFVACMHAIWQCYVSTYF